MNFLLYRPTIFFVFLTTLFSCNTHPTAAVTEMEFNVDSSIVNKPESDTSLNIRYAVPGSWHPIETTEDVLKQVHAGNIRVSKMLKNPEGTVVFSLTDVRQVADTVFRNMDENYKSVLNPAGSWSSVDRAEFITSGYQVKQYVMARQGQTFFKMLFGDRMRPSFQVDYSIMIDSAYASNTKTLESIIGSLQRDH